MKRLLAKIMLATVFVMLLLSSSVQAAKNTPRGNGCFYRINPGCKNPSAKKTDKFVSDNRAATKYGKNYCLTIRKREWEKFCGAKRIQMLWVGKDTQKRGNGCFVRINPGCKNPSAIKAARKRKNKFVSDSSAVTKYGKTYCLTIRKREWESFCGAKRIQMLWEGKDTQKRGNGCFVRINPGCKNPSAIKASRKRKNKFVSDSSAVTKYGKTYCLTIRKREWESFCGAKKIQMLWEGKDTQKRGNGCFVRINSGCKNPSAIKAAQKRKNKFVSDNSAATKYGKTYCLTIRKREWESFCGAKRIQMLWEGKDTQKRRNGCYVRINSGCKNPSAIKDARKRKNKFVFDNRAAKKNGKNYCLTVRKREWEIYCGAKRIQMLWEGKDTK